MEGKSARERALTVSILLVAGAAPAQDSLRNSLAGDAAAEAQRKQFESQLYTFKAGDFKLLAVPSLELDYNDNVTLRKTDRQADFILRPLLTLSGAYPVTEQNLLSFSVGAGYDEYIEHSQYSAPRVISDSQTAFDTRIKDFVFNFHDRFSFTQNPGTEATVVGTAQYGGLMNSAGFSATWDLEDVKLTVGYDHQNFWSSSTQFKYLNRGSELPIARAGFSLNPRLTVGIEGSASFTSYDERVLNDNESYSAGVYADWNPGSSFEIKPRAGYTIYQFQHTSESGQIFLLTPTGSPIFVPTGQTIRTQDRSSWYADLSVSHNITKTVSYGVSAGHELRLGIESDLVEDTYFRPSVTWAIFKDLNLVASVFYEHGRQGVGNVTGNFAETYDWFGGSLEFTYSLMKRLGVGLSYRPTFRSSSIHSGEYSQNLVALRFFYQPQ
jgi:hypothetical protein